MQKITTIHLLSIDRTGNTQVTKHRVVAPHKVTFNSGVTKVHHLPEGYEPRTDEQIDVDYYPNHRVYKIEIRYVED
jgi:hypothetical protein